MMRALLARIFGMAVRARTHAYDRGWFAAGHPGVPVISVGNITVGGAGKTPIVDYCLGLLVRAGLRPVMVSRGYGRSTRGTVVVSDGAGSLVDPRSGGDEPVQIARRHPSVPVVVDEQRLRGCRHAVARFQPGVIVLDDAFQHRACARDLDIVAIDAARAHDELQLMPAGRLREPLAHLARAHVIVLTRCDDDVATSALEADIRRHTTAQIFRSRFDVVGMVRAAGASSASTADLRNAATDPAVDVMTAGDGAGRIRGPVIAFCGIGSPDSFRRTLLRCGIEPREILVFPDHRPYNAHDLARIADAAGRANARDIITTEKDAVRLGSRLQILSEYRILYPEISLLLLDDGAAFDRCILAAARGESHPMSAPTGPARHVVPRASSSGDKSMS